MILTKTKNWYIIQLYNEEKESWMEYYVELTEEDNLEEEEMYEL